MTENALNNAAAARAPAGICHFAGQLAAMRGWRRAGVCFAAGAASVLGQAPFHLWPLLFLTFPLLTFMLDGAGGAGERRWAGLWQAAKLGWWFGFGTFLAGLYWIGASFLVEPDKFIWVMPFAVAGLCAGLAIFYAGACAAAVAAWRPGPARIFALAASFFAAEWLRGHVLTGFPWNMPGYTLTGNGALLQSASLLGGYGLTFFAVLIFASPAALVAMAGRPGTGKASWSLPVMALMLLAGAFVWGNVRLGQASGAVVDGVKLRLVQANIPQAEKWKPENRAWIFKRYLDLSGDDGGPPGAGITHVIWPESSLSFLFMVDGAIYDASARDAIKTIIPEGGTFILGGLRAETRRHDDGKRYAERIFNSLFVLNSKAEVTAAYDKIHLVPFGEYLPLAGFIRSLGFKHLVQLADAFSAGRGRQNIATARAPDFLPLICYEAVFPGEVLPDGGKRPGWLLNLTDDSWFGATTGPYQHLQQARMRAVEEGLPVVRVANTGISAVIDAHGVIRASTALEVPARLDVALPVALSTTFYGGHRNGVLIIVVVFALAGYMTFLKFN